MRYHYFQVQNKFAYLFLFLFIIGFHSSVFAKSTLSRVEAPVISFLENNGRILDQFHKPRTDIQYSLAANKGLTIFVGRGALHYQFALPLKGALDSNTIETYRMDVELLGANKSAHVVAGRKQEYQESYYNQNASKDGITVSAFDRLTYIDIYPNIDWVIYVANGHLEHEFRVKQGGKVTDIQLKYSGATNLKIAENGSLLAETPLGAIKEQPPITWKTDGSIVASKYVLNGNLLTYNIEAHSAALTIDPGLEWATYYGGSSYDYATAVTTDAAGNVYMAGQTNSLTGIATTGGFLNYLYDGPNAFLVKFSPSGNRLWATYYYGQEDNCSSVATDAAGNVFLAGATGGTFGIATVGGFREYACGGIDAFLVKFNSAGNRLWATYFGGSNIDRCNSVATDKAGNVYIGGYTASDTGIASTGAYQSALSGANDAFIAKFSNAGARLWSTYYGGSNVDVGFAIAIDTSGNPYLCGGTFSTNGIATTGAMSSFNSGGEDAFVVKFNGSGSRLWGTYFGGGNTDEARSVAIDASNNAYLAGFTDASSGLATSGAWQASFGGGTQDGFLLKTDSTGARLWSTYYGGSGRDQALAVATYRNSMVYLAGYTGTTTGFTTSGAPQSTYGGGYSDAYLAGFSSSGSRLWTTYLGGSDSDATNGLVVTPDNHIYMTGYTYSPTGVATTGAFQTTYGGGHDGFLAKYDTCAFLNTGVITGLPTVCVGDSVMLVSTALGGVWSAQNSNATIAGGLVVGVSAGTDVFSYTVSNVCGLTRSAIYTMTINPMPGVISGGATVCAGSNVTFTDTSAGGIWWSNNTSVATIGSLSGAISGLSAGTAIITYQLPAGCFTTKSLVVNPTPTAISGTDTLCEGSTATLTDITTGGLWSSSNLGIGTIIPASGIITGIVSGTTIVTYSLATGCFKTKTVIVNPLPHAGEISGADTVCESDSLLLTSPIPGGLWSADNGNVTISSSGLVIGVVAGTSLISYTVTNSCGTVAATHLITILPASTCINGIGKIAEGEEIYVYPNPNSGVFKLGVNYHPGSKGILQITDVLGKQVAAPINITTGEMEINIKGISPGVYLIKVDIEGRILHQKMIIW